MKLLIPLLLFSSYLSAQSPSEKDIPLLKVVKNTIGSESSNIAVFNYDDSSCISFIAEFLKTKDGWKQLHAIQYVRDEDGILREIRRIKLNRSRYEILDVPKTDTIVFSYNNAGLLIKMQERSGSYYKTFDYTEDNKIMRTIYVDNATNAIWHFTAYVYEKKTGVISQEYEIDVKNERAGIPWIIKHTYDDKKSFATQLLWEDQNIVVFNPFASITPAYYSNTYETKIRKTLWGGTAAVEQRFSYNDAGFPSGVGLYYQTGNSFTSLEMPYHYSFYYGPVTEKVSFTDFINPANAAKFAENKHLPAYTSLKQEALFRWKPTKESQKNIAPLDLRNGRALTAWELLFAEKSHIVLSDQESRQAKSISKMSKSLLKKSQSPAGKADPGLNKALLVHSLNDKTFRIDNNSNYPLLVKITGHKSVFLKPQDGATYQKEDITNETLLTARLPDSSVNIRLTMYKNQIAALQKEITDIEKTVANNQPSAGAYSFADTAIKQINNREFKKADDIVVRDENNNVTDVIRGDQAMADATQIVENTVFTGIFKAWQKEQADNNAYYLPLKVKAKKDAITSLQNQINDLENARRELNIPGSPQSSYYQFAPLIQLIQKQN